jgi:hypothetical protein
MLQPNDLPLVCLPVDLSDEAAVQLVDFLHELSAALERHYGAQLRRYYSGTTDLALPDSEVDDSDPPF